MSDAESERDATRKRVREAYEAHKGYWPEGHSPALELDPEWLESFLAYGRAVISKKALDPKVRELIFIAVDACVTHLYAPGARSHIKRALQIGVTTDEILEVLEIISLVGAHSTAMAFPLLKEVLEEIDTEKDAAAPRDAD
jgi:alkylhydroperoxidase/carboxymuconolactone decarboxylase family protein YurZ